MELKLKPAFFWPINSTIVRSFKFSAGLTWQRALHRLLWRTAPQQAIELAARLMLTPPGHHFPDAELRLMEEASLVPVPLITGRLVGWRWGRSADPVVVLCHAGSALPIQWGRHRPDRSDRTCTRPPATGSGSY